MPSSLPDLPSLYLARVRERTAVRDLTTAEFIERVVKDDQGRALEIAPVHQAILDHIEDCYQRGKWCQIIAPWEIGKTTMSLGWILQRIGLDGPRGWRCKIVSSNDGAAMKRVGWLKKYIERDDDFHALFPAAQPGGRWTDHKFDLSKQVITLDSTVEGHGLFTGDMGSRADMILFDDILDARNSLSTSEIRRKVVETFENYWISRVRQGGFVLCINNVWHIEDLTQELKRRPSYSTLELPFLADLSGRMEARYYEAA